MNLMKEVLRREIDSPEAQALFRHARQRIAEGSFKPKVPPLPPATTARIAVVAAHLDADIDVIGVAGADVLAMVTPRSGGAIRFMGFHAWPVH